VAIFKELDETDKVAGRVTSIHDGLFSGDNPSEMIEFFYDEEKHKTPLREASSDIDIYDNWITPSKEDYYADVFHEEVYIAGLLNQNSQQQFSVSYGHVNGFGSPIRSAFNGKTPQITKAVYSQYKNILLNPDDKRFTFTKKVDNSFVGYDADCIHVINFSAARMKERIDEGNFVFTLGVSVNNQINYRVAFQDASVFGTSLNYVSSSPQSGRVFDLVKVANSDRYNNDESDIIRMTSEPESTADLSGHDIRYSPVTQLGFGLVYPDLGIIVINSKAVAEQLCEGLDTAVSNYESLGNSIPTDYVKEENEGAKFSWYGDIAPEYTDSNGNVVSVDSLDSDPETPTTELSIHNPNTWLTSTTSGNLLNRAGGNRNHQNFLKLLKSLQQGAKFECRNTEIIPSKHYFIRIKNTDFNYSNNPSFVYQGYEARTLATRSNAELDNYLGRIRHGEFIDDPRVYITTVGLYNDDNELVAVAKLSKPILKTFDSEALIKVKLDF
jgi:hypothetical protein